MHLFPRMRLLCNKYHYLHLHKFQNLFVCFYCSLALVNLYVLPMLLWGCFFFQGPLEVASQHLLFIVSNLLVLDRFFSMIAFTLFKSICSKIVVIWKTTPFFLCIFILKIYPMYVINLWRINSQLIHQLTLLYNPNWKTPKQIKNASANMDQMNFDAFMGTFILFELYLKNVLTSHNWLKFFFVKIVTNLVINLHVFQTI